MEGSEQQINTDSSKVVAKPSRIVKLQTKEGDIIEVGEDVITKSVLIKGMIDDSGDNLDESIPLPEVTKETLEKVLTYLNYIMINAPPVVEKPIKSPNISDQVN